MARSKRTRRRHSQKTGQLKVYLLIMLGTFVVAAAISFVTGKVPGFVENVLNKQIESAISQKVGDVTTGETTDDPAMRSEIERLKKEFKKMRR